MHNKSWLLVNSNDTERKNVFNKFKANKMDFIEYDQIFVPLHVNNNQWQLPIIDLHEHIGLKIFYLIILKQNYYEFLCFFFYMCLFVVHHSINSIFCYDSLILSKFFKIKTKFICQLNILS